MLIDEGVKKTREACRTTRLRRDWKERPRRHQKLPFWAESVLACSENLDGGIPFSRSINEAGDSQMSENKWHKKVLGKREHVSNIAY